MDDHKLKITVEYDPRTGETDTRKMELQLAITMLNTAEIVLLDQYLKSMLTKKEDSQEIHTIVTADPT